MTKHRKVYLGDSVYAEFEGGFIRLTTENGRPGDPSNAIFLEPAVIDAFLEFVAELRKPDPRAARADA